MYSPKIKEDLIRRLYQLKHSDPNKTPMTRLVNEAVETYLERRNKIGQEENSETDRSSGNNPQGSEEINESKEDKS